MTDTRWLAAALLVVSVGCARPTTREDVTIASGDVALAATLVTPATDGNHPGVVLVHGSGPDGRSNEYYWLLAEAFTRRGFAVVIYDKRGSGGSSGD